MNILRIVMFGAITLEVIFVPIFLKVEWPDRSCRSLVCKQVCSALFLVVGLCAVFYVKNDSVYAWLVLGALFCSFPGDALLHYEAIVQKDVFSLRNDCFCLCPYPLSGGILRCVRQAVPWPEPF